MFRPRAHNAPKIMMCTILSASAGGLCSAFLKPLVMGTYSQQLRYDVGALSNGIISGLVSVTGVCDCCEPWSAIMIGLIAGIVYSFSCSLMRRLGLDDPVEAAMVHGFCGAWGVIAVGVFDNELGLISSSMDSTAFFGWQVVGMLAILAWTVALSLPYFAIMRRLGLLRVPLIHEIIGLDVAEMGSKSHIDKIIKVSFFKAHERWKNDPDFLNNSNSLGTEQSNR